MYTLKKTQNIAEKYLKDLNKGRNISHSWVRRLNIIKTSTLPQFIYRFNVIPIEIPAGFFMKMDSKSYENPKNLD